MYQDQRSPEVAVGGRTRLRLGSPSSIPEFLRRFWFRAGHVLSRVVRPSTPNLDPLSVLLLTLDIEAIGLEQAMELLLVIGLPIRLHRLDHALLHKP